MVGKPCNLMGEDNSGIRKQCLNNKLFNGKQKGDIVTLNFGKPRRQAHSTTSPPARSEQGKKRKKVN